MESVTLIGDVLDHSCSEICTYLFDLPEASDEIAFEPIDTDRSIPVG